MTLLENMWMGSPEVHQLEFIKSAISVDPLLGLAL